MSQKQVDPLYKGYLFSGLCQTVLYGCDAFKMERFLQDPMGNCIPCMEQIIAI